MAQLLVRNVEPKIIEKLRARAKKHRRSVQAEVLEILDEALVYEVTPEERQRAIAELDRIREGLRGRWDGDSTELIREARDALDKRWR